jgi:hypothetical protein
MEFVLWFLVRYLLYAVDRLILYCSGTSRAAKFLRANGITFLKVQEQTFELLGKSDYFFSSPVPPPLTEPLQKALDWAVNEKLKSGMHVLHDDMSMYRVLTPFHFSQLTS